MFFTSDKDPHVCCNADPDPDLVSYQLCRAGAADFGAALEPEPIFW